MRKSDRSRKRLCIILPTHWLKKMGGAQYQIKCLVDHWAPKKYFDIILLCRNPGKDKSDGNGYQLIPLKAIDRLSHYGSIFDTWHLYNALKQINPDIIYQKIGTAYAGAAALYAKQFNKFFTLHLASDNDLLTMQPSLKYKRWIPYLDRKILHYGIQHADCVIAQTRFQQSLLQRNLNIDNSYLVPNFQPVPEASLISKKKEVKVLWVANLKKLKQPELFIRLAQEFETIDRSVKFFMIGAPANWENQWQGKISKAIQKTKNLTYLGAQPLNKVNELFRESHILINTSLYEGFSNTFIQAWFNEVPVISLNCDPDGILEKHNLGLFCNGSYKRMLGGLKKLIDEKETRDRMGKDSRAYAVKNHSLDNTRVILNLLRNV